MSLLPDVIMQQRRGVKSKLPTTALAGQLIVTTDTNELYVGTGTSLAKINAADSAHKTNRILFDDNVNVYADGNKGTLDAKGREGWYYTNPAGRKINWYYYDATQSFNTVSQFNGTYAVITFDTNKIPFFAIYTAGADFGWYKSVRTYYIANPTSVTPGTKYVIYTGTNPSAYPELPRIQLTTDPANTIVNKGAFAATETIQYVTMHTDSGASVNSYKFVTHNLGVLSATESYELQLKVKSDVALTVPVTTANTTWTINHNLYKRPAVTVVNEAGDTIFGDVQHPNDQQVIIKFSVAMKGSVYLN